MAFLSLYADFYLIIWRFFLNDLFIGCYCYLQAEKIAALVKAANLTVESYWPSLFAKLCDKRNIEDLILNVGSGGGAASVAVAAPGAAAGGAAPADAAPAAEEKKVNTQFFLKKNYILSIPFPILTLFCWMAFF